MSDDPVFIEYPPAARSLHTCQLVLYSAYVGYKGYDYIPSDAPPNQVPVTDIGTGYTVTSQEACSEECNAAAAAGSNSASYYGLMPNADWPAGKNCWLKTISVACKLPSDPLVDNPLALLLMKVTGEDCMLL